MRIAILGTGNVGTTLGRRWAQCGHIVSFGSRDPESVRAKELQSEHDRGFRVSTFAGAIQDSELVVLAVPYGSMESTLSLTGDLSGKVLIDCTNPLNATFDGMVLGFTDSAAEQIARMAPGAHVVKAFNTASVATMRDPIYNSVPATMFYCGDSELAKAMVRQVILDLGMEPVDSGLLKNARYLEPMAMLYIHLAVQQGWGGHCALKIMTR